MKITYGAGKKENSNVQLGEEQIAAYLTLPQISVQLLEGEMLKPETARKVARAAKQELDKQWRRH